MSSSDSRPQPPVTKPSPLAAQQPWEDVAEGYAAEADWVMLPFSREAARRMALSPSDEVLDVAAGPGTLSLEVAPQVRRVHAVDFSPTMIELLRGRASARALSSVTAEVGNGMQLGVPEQSFDAAFSMFGLMFFPDRSMGFSELYRALRPGGRVLVSSWAPVSESTMMQAMFGALRAADPAREPPEANLLNLENPAVFRAELEAAGFVDVRVEAYREGFEIHDGADLWDRMARAGAPFVALRKALGPEAWQQQSDQARAYLVERVGKGPVELGSTAWLGFGRRPAASS